MVACTRAMTFWTEKLNTPACVPSLVGSRAFNLRESRANPRTPAFWAAQAVRIRAIRARSGATPRASHGSRTRQPQLRCVPASFRARKKRRDRV